MTSVGWEWWDTFRLHQAACLIAGVPVMQKRAPKMEELPPEARRVFIYLLNAFILKGKHDKGHPDVANYRLEEMLTGELPEYAEEITEILVSRAEMHRFVKAVGRPSAYQFGPIAPISSPALAESELEGSTGHTQDAERRLAKLRTLGGGAVYKRGMWKFKGIASLVASEKAEGRMRSTEKTIRADLKDAAQAESDAKRAGPWQGLGG